MYKELYDIKNDTEIKEKVKNIFPGTDKLTKAYAHFSTIPLVYNENNKVSAYLTIMQAKENNIEDFYQILFFGQYRWRSDMYDTTNRNKFNLFVPLFMASHKEYNNVMYEDWDKTDKAFPNVVGTLLWETLKDYLEPIKGLDDKLEEKVKEIGGNNKKFQHKHLKSDNGLVAKFASSIKGQFWFCHPDNRTPYMILDTVNWDNIPEPMGEDKNKKINKVVSTSSEDYSGMFF